MDSIGLGDFSIEKFQGASTAPIAPDQIGILRMQLEANANVREYLAELEKKIRQKLTEIQFVEKCHTQLAFENGLLVTEIKRHLPPRAFKPWLRTFLDVNRIDSVYRTLASHENLYQAISLLCKKEAISAQEFIAKNSEIAASIWYRLGSDNYKNVSLDELYTEFRRIKNPDDYKQIEPGHPEPQSLPVSVPAATVSASDVNSTEASELLGDPLPATSTNSEARSVEAEVIAPPAVEPPRFTPQKPPVPNFDATPSKLKVMSAQELQSLDKDSLVSCYSILQNAYTALAQKEKINANLIRELKEQIEIAEEEIADLKLEESKRVEVLKREKDLEIKRLTDMLAEVDPYKAAQLITVEEILATPLSEVLALAESAPKETLVTIADSLGIPKESYTSRGNVSLSPLKMTVIAKITSLIQEQENPDRWM